MNKENVKEFMYILIAVVLGIIAVKFFIWLLPIILTIMCSYYIYKYIKKNRSCYNKKSDIKIIDVTENKESKK